MLRIHENQLTDELLWNHCEEISMDDIKGCSYEQVAEVQTAVGGVVDAILHLSNDMYIITDFMHGAHRSFNKAIWENIVSELS